MEDSEASFLTLFCNEDESCLDEQCLWKDENLETCSVSETDSEYIEMLIQKENEFQSNGTVGNDRNWLQCARADAIKWILDTRALFGFHYRTAYLSLIYLDRFLSRRLIGDGKLWVIRLLSVACLSLAAKMEECVVPALSEYHVDEYNFEGNVVRRMELLVLDTLEWKMNYVTPFTYLSYFIIKFFGESKDKELITRAVELILVLVEEISVAEHRPSIIAAAAVLAASDHQLTKKIIEIKLNAIQSWGSLEKERTFSFYSLLQEVVRSKSQTPTSILCWNSLSTRSSSIDVVDDSSIVTSAGGIKRRLTYTNDDQHCPPPKIPKS